jgi:hypothetical protein
MTTPDYTSDDPNARLAAIRAAIANCLLAQSNSIGGRSVRIAELNQLLALEQFTMAQINSMNGTYGSRPVQKDNPT